MEQNNQPAQRKKNTARIRYRPDRLFDTLLKRLQLNSDAELARVLEVVPAVISKTRNRLVPVSAGLLVRIHEVTGLSIEELRRLMGDERSHFASYKGRAGKKQVRQKTQRQATPPGKNGS